MYSSCALRGLVMLCCTVSQATACRDRFSPATVLLGPQLGLWPLGLVASVLSSLLPAILGLSLLTLYCRDAALTLCRLHSFTGAHTLQECGGVSLCDPFTSDLFSLTPLLCPEDHCSHLQNSPLLRPVRWLSFSSFAGCIRTNWHL